MSFGSQTDKGISFCDFSGTDYNNKQARVHAHSLFKHVLSPDILFNLNMKAGLHTYPSWGSYTTKYTIF